MATAIEPLVLGDVLVDADDPPPQLDAATAAENMKTE
jgi:hypothetical protein